ncbi:MAG: GAF domain-containing protein [Verrucomicrobiota bacterium]|nr:GAF domain-containing protein [Verrucomicrobiota bacterium]
MHTKDNEQTAIDSLYRISSLVTDTDDPKIALQLILDEIVQVLKPNSASILLVNPNTQDLDLEVSFGLPENWKNAELALGRGITGWTALHGRAQIIKDVKKEPRYISARPNIRSEMTVPMKDQGIVIGVVNVDSEKVNAYDEGSLKILTLLTNEATRVVTRIWLIGQLRVKANQLESLVMISQRLTEDRDSDSLMQAITLEAHQLIDGDASALFVMSSEKDSLLLHSLVVGDKFLKDAATIPLDYSALGTVIHRNKQIEVHDLNFTEEYDFLKVIKREGLTSMLASPIVFGEDTIGAIISYTRRSHRFSNGEKKVFKTLAEMAASAIQNSRLYSQIFASEESMRRNEKLTTLGMLAAEIAHEIRNPLTVIKLLFDSLNLQFGVNDPRHTDAQIIREKLDQLEEIIERVLSFGRTNAGVHSRQNLNEMIDDTLKLVRIKLDQQKIDIIFKPFAQGTYVDVNKGQILQVILNLILNATQAMPNGGTIYIETTIEGELTHMTISDNGIGIPQAIKDNIFESFLTNRPDGTGLGLSISKRIMRAHRGDIELSCSSPKGTTFHCWLPITK